MVMLTSTIAAISTPPGKGGVAVIRISGQEALQIAEKMFTPLGKKILKSSPRVQIYGSIIHEGHRIDDGMATYFPTPNSYTGEDTVEISCHGGSLITKTVLEAALASGATAATAGEFTRRAFINGKLSLTDAEAIGILLDAESDGQLKLGRSEARQRLSEKISQLREKLVSVISSIYARIDYPDEDLGDFTVEETLKILKLAKADTERLISTYKTGRAVTEGIKTVICGRPNAGKSTLYNLLVGEDAAIVTDLPGTTRDVLEYSVPIGNLILRLCDTAGIRESTKDPIEAIGIERSKARIDGAELILALFDSSSSLNDEDIAIIEYLEKAKGEKIALLTKGDILDSNCCEDTKKLLKLHFSDVITISAKSDDETAVKAISDKAEQLFCDEKITVGTDAVVSSARQHASLLRTKEFLDSAISAYESGLPHDVASSDIELALGAIGELDGRAVSQEVVSDIFAKFCVGK